MVVLPSSSSSTSSRNELWQKAPCIAFRGAKVSQAYRPGLWATELGFGSGFRVEGFRSSGGFRVPEFPSYTTSHELEGRGEEISEMATGNNCNSAFRTTSDGAKTCAHNMGKFLCVCVYMYIYIYICMYVCMYVASIVVYLFYFRGCVLVQR